MDESDFIKGRGAIIEFPSFKLVEIQKMCKTLEIHRNTAVRLCHALHIPLVYIGKNTFYNDFAFELAMYALSRYGSTGFAAPGSALKKSGKPKLNVPTTLDIDVTDPTLLIEMLGAKSRTAATTAKVAELIKKIEQKREAAGVIEPKGESNV